MPTWGLHKSSASFQKKAINTRSSCPWAHKHAFVCLGQFPKEFLEDGADPQDHRWVPCTRTHEWVVFCWVTWDDGQVTSLGLSLINYKMGARLKPHRAERSFIAKHLVH